MNQDGPVRPVRLTIGSVDDDKLTVSAHYNPKEIELAIQATWKDFDKIQGRVPQQSKDIIDLEYMGLPAPTMSLELFFDGFEKGESIESNIQKLRKMASPQDEESDNPMKLRPHLCVIAWGQRDFASFRCVIESINVKYTMFSVDGLALRAVCQLKLKEARIRRGAVPGLIEYLIQ
jgi:Contractile injection system tube protein